MPSATDVAINENGRSSALSVDANKNLTTTLATALAGEDLTNDVLKVENRASYTNVTASIIIKTGAGRFYGFIVNSHTNGTVKFWDNTSGATTVILNTITLAAGPAAWVFPVGINFSTGLYITVGGTADVTVLWA